MSYSVVKGDSLWGIYKRNKAKGNTSSWEDYKKANPEFANGKTMYEGDSVTIPSKTIPDDAFDESKEKVEAKEEPVEQNKTSDEKAEEAVEETKNESSKNSEAADCCCMVAPWTVEEEDRAYILKVTKVGQEKVLNSDKMMDVSVKEEVSNKEKKTYELHVVTKEPKSDGKVDYKKLTSNHTFLRKKCDLGMILKDKDTKNIGEFIEDGESFEIDTNGSIKNIAKETLVKEEYKSDVYFPNATLGVTDPYAVLKNLNNEIQGEKSLGTLSDLIGNTSSAEQDLARQHYFLQCRMEVSQLKRQALLEESYAQSFGQGKEADEQSSFGLTSLFTMLFKPTAPRVFFIAPTGSPKCVSQPKVSLHVHPYFKMKGLASFSIAERYIETTLQNKRSLITSDSIKAAIALEIERGTQKYAFTHEANREKAKEKIKTKNIQNSGIVFGPFSRVVTKIYKASATANKMSKHRAGKGTNSFDPGMTKFEFGAEDLMLTEDGDSHEVYWKGKAVLSLTFFDGANITLDLIPYVIGLGGPIAKLVEKAIKIAAEETGKTKAGQSVSEHINGSIKLELVVKGSAKGAMELEFVDKKTITSTGSIGGKVEFEIVGLAESGLNAFGVEAGAGASFKSGSTKNSSDGTDISCELKIEQAKQGEMPTFKGDIKTDGLAIYYAWYTYVKPKTDDINKDSNGRGGLKHKPELKFTDEDKIDFIQPFSFIDEIKKRIG